MTVTSTEFPDPFSSVRSPLAVLRVISETPENEFLMVFSCAFARKNIVTSRIVVVKNFIILNCLLINNYLKDNGQ